MLSADQIMEMLAQRQAKARNNKQTIILSKQKPGPLRLALRRSRLRLIQRSAN
jgi:hypothetical protein